MPLCPCRGVRVRPASDEAAAHTAQPPPELTPRTIEVKVQAPADDKEKGKSQPSDEELLRAWLLPKTSHYFMHGGKRLHVRHWLPGGPIRASVIYVHGLNCHVNEPSAADPCQSLANAGYAVLAFDLSGNGYSEGLRAYVEDFHDLFEEVVRFAEITAGGVEDKESNLGLDESVLAKVRSLPFFLLGFSMGGLIAFFVALRLQDGPRCLSQKFNGLVLVAPALAADIPPWIVVRVMQALIVPLAGKRLMPTMLAGAAEPKAEFIGRDEEYFAMAKLDSVNLFPNTGLGWQERMRWATASAFANIFGRINKDMTRLRCPFLVLHDPEDRITAFRGSQRLVTVAASKDKTLLEAINALHGILCTEPEWSMGEIISWLGLRC